MDPKKRCHSSLAENNASFGYIFFAAFRPFVTGLNSHLGIQLSRVEIQDLFKVKVRGRRLQGFPPWYLPEKLFQDILGISRRSHFCSINHHLCLIGRISSTVGNGSEHPVTDGPKKRCLSSLAGGITLPLVTFFVAFLRPFVTGFTRFEPV